MGKGVGVYREVTAWASGGEPSAASRHRPAPARSASASAVLPSVAGAAPDVAAAEAGEDFGAGAAAADADEALEAQAAAGEERPSEAVEQARRDARAAEEKFEQATQALEGEGAPADDKDGDEALAALRFGRRCARIENSTKCSTANMKEVLEHLEGQIDDAKKELATLEARGAVAGAGGGLRHGGKLRKYVFGCVISRAPVIGSLCDPRRGASEPRNLREFRGLQHGRFPEERS